MRQHVHVSGLAGRAGRARARGDGLETRAVVMTGPRNAIAGRSAGSSRVVPLAGTRFRARATRKNALPLPRVPRKAANSSSNDSAGPRVSARTRRLRHVTRARSTD
mmetsp:Transcript_15861/g.66889  ORF Transcript_15861/g.66889 Transcript_15861/m.66889 type:complete len:106 (-) Transcript_15861:141-458(-)